MECEFEGGKFDDFIIQDPYLFPAAHGGRLVGLWCNGGLCGLLAVLIWLPWFRPKMKDRLKIKLCSWYAVLTSCGNALEALATCVLSENDGFALMLIARMVTITSLGPLLALANGLGEAIWPSKRWQDVWIVSILFLLGSLAGFLTLSLMLRDFGVLALGCTMALGFFYTGAVWLLTLLAIRERQPIAYTGVIAVILLAGSYIFLGLTDLTCGPPGHVDCYVHCFLGQGGTHYILWMAVVLGANGFLWMHFYDDQPRGAQIQWPKILTFRMFHPAATDAATVSVPEPSAATDA
mmetsp:Transcript_26279/g.57490  ORF Transcript_26279/g.57490 Transcript_26279/m.57490 type:complete len:293 (-) Transcript_26279:244-1122(-)